MEHLITAQAPEEPTTAAHAHNSWSIAAQRALAKGLPVTIIHDSRHLRVYPDGRVEDVGPTGRETSAQIAARLEMGRSDLPRFELPDEKIPPAFREIAETIAALS